MKKNIAAMDLDGMDALVMILTLEILEDDPEFDLLGQIKKAVAHYLKTDEGRKVYENNCHCFNWATLMPVSPTVSAPCTDSGKWMAPS